MKNLIFKDDLLIQVTFALLALISIALVVTGLWFLFFYMPSHDLSAANKAFAYVLIPIFGIFLIYIAPLLCAVSFGNIESKIAQKGIKFSSEQDEELAIILFIPAAIITVLLRLIGVNGRPAKTYSNACAKYKDSAK